MLNCWKKKIPYCLELLKKIPYCLEYNQGCFLKYKTSKMVHSLVFFLGNSCRPQRYFLKCKTSRAMYIYKLYFFVARCTSHKHFKIIFVSFLFFLYSCLRVLWDVLVFIWRVWMYWDRWMFVSSLYVVTIFT